MRRASTGADMARVLLCFWVVAPSGARWDGGISPEQAFAAGWRYLAPVTPPAEVAALRARVERLEAALKPFADTAAWIERQWPTVKNYQGLEIVCAPIPEHHFTVGEMAIARAALGDTP